MANLLRLSKTKGDPRIPFKTTTLYKWRHTKKFPKLFIKVAGALFVDLDVLNQIIEAGRLE